jgi:hypothetical protein
MIKQNKHTNRVHRINQHNRNATEVKQSKHYNKVSNKDTGPIVFDMPEIEAQEIDGRIVMKMGGRIMDGFQIQQWMEDTYRQFDAACREYLEVVPPL